jgi:hypothetical protein
LRKSKRKKITKTKLVKADVKHGAVVVASKPRRSTAAQIKTHCPAHLQEAQAGRTRRRAPKMTSCFAVWCCQTGHPNIRSSRAGGMFGCSDDLPDGTLRFEGSH